MKAMPMETCKSFREIFHILAAGLLPPATVSTGRLTSSYRSVT